MQSHEASADLFRALSHPVRVRIVELLGQRDHIVHELLAAIPVEASTLSQQLAVLRRVGLVRQQRVGGEVVYTLAEPALGDVLAAARAVQSVAVVERAGRGGDLRSTTWDSVPTGSGLGTTP